jgi:hypothetical protein
MAMLLSWLHCTLSYTYTLLPDETVEVDNGLHVMDREDRKESTRWRAHGQGGQGVQHCSTIYTRDSWLNEKEKIAKGKSVIVRLSCWAHISPSSANNLFIHVHVPVDAINTAMFMNMHSDDERETLPQITRVISFYAALRVFHLLR